MPLGVDGPTFSYSLSQIAPVAEEGKFRLCDHPPGEATAVELPLQSKFS